MALVVLVGLGLVHGAISHRWTASVDARDLGRRLDKLPREFANWSGSDEEIDPTVLRNAEISHYVYRKYEDDRSGATVALLAVVGDPGPISIHTPEVCFRGMGYEAPRAVRRKQIDVDEASATQAAAFFTADFQRKRIDAVTTRAYWSWNSGQGWSAPKNPRIHFAGSGALCKLYVVSEAPPRGDEEEEDVALSFIRDVIPQLDQALFEEASL